MPDDKRTEEERVDDALAGEHTYEPGGETPDYLREWAEKALGVKLPERPAK